MSLEIGLFMLLKLHIMYRYNMSKKNNNKGIYGCEAFFKKFFKCYICVWIFASQLFYAIDTIDAYNMSSSIPPSIKNTEGLF